MIPVKIIFKLKNRMKKWIVVGLFLNFSISSVCADKMNDFLIEADAYLAQGKFPYAVATYQKVIDIDPKNAKAYVGIAIAYDNMFAHDRALTYIKKASVLDSSDPEAYFYLGVLYGNHEDYDKAIEYFMKTIQLDPNYVEAYLNLGVMYWHKGKTNKAIDFFRKFIETHPGATTNRYIIGKFEVDDVDYYEEIECGLESIKREPKNPRAYCRLGTAYCRVDQCNNAIDYYKKAIDLAPGYGRAYQSLGAAYELMDNKEKAGEFYKKAAKISSNYKIFYQNLNNLSVHGVVFDLEVRCMEKNIKPKLFPDFADAYYYLGRAYCHQGDGINTQNQINELQKLDRFDLLLDLRDCIEEKVQDADRKY